MASRVSGRAAAVGRIEHEFGDALLAGGDVGFAAHEGAVVHARDQGGVGGGGGIDAAAGGENLGGQLDGVGEVAGDLSERGDEEIAEVVAFEPVAGAEAVGEELGQQVLFFAESDHAVAQVAGREHVEVLAQAAGGAAVVSDGDDGGEVGDLAGNIRLASRGTQRGGAGRAAGWRGRCRRRWPRRGVRRASRSASSAWRMSSGWRSGADGADFVDGQKSQNS